MFRFSFRGSFLVKVAAGLLLVSLADFLFYGREPGSTLGLFALAWVAALGIALPGVWRSRAARVALACAALLALVLVDDPGPLAWLLYWAALSLAALLPGRRFDDAFRWGLRLARHAAAGWVTPLRDAARCLPQPAQRGGFGRAAGLLGLPLAGGVVFTGLFASANPVLAQMLVPLAGDMVPRMIFWAAAAALVWPSLKPLRASPRLRLAGAAALALPGISVGSVTLSLLLFNGLFACENLLDVAFLWRGAALPAGVTIADYVHRGAYPLIVTALLAGAFVLLAARPGTAIARRPLIRGLVVLWIAQNLFLVASCAARTLKYVDVYMLTVLRLSALVWMGLVAAGLALICWRMLRGRSAAWLVNANALAAALVLAGATVVDFGTVVAQWNVTHAREVGGTAQPLDLCYLRSLGPSALVPLARLESRLPPSDFRDRVAGVRGAVMADALRAQAGGGWTWRNARRIGQARTALASSAIPEGLDCYDTVLP